jgi:hypothetical protein
MWTTVGVPGFEPGTSRTRTVRSTGLSHTPMPSAQANERANYTTLICFGKPFELHQGKCYFAGYRCIRKNVTFQRAKAPVGGAT